MSGWKNPELHAALAAKHGDRMPRGYGLLIRRGWYPLIDRLLSETGHRYPHVRIDTLRGYGGWLRIKHTIPDSTGFIERSEIEKYLQGYVTESTWTCEECSSHRGLHWHAASVDLGHAISSHYDRIICPDCRPAFETQFRNQRQTEILKSMPLNPFIRAH
ncbi:hypothetical protein F4695_004336 [Rhizobium soli]|uniref:Uncharacterized protein n=1 Tax=Rhizobium soli TaxID=424798 RepID=A0A7X0JNL8_9HYPH|nr:hypothetical protein [Rhizobium soli]MBB6510944.1 hypothetical protein [Rhizobium soli]